MVLVVVQLLLKCYVFIYVFFIVCVNQWYISYVLLIIIWSLPECVDRHYYGTCICFKVSYFIYLFPGVDNSFYTIILILDVILIPISKICKKPGHGDHWTGSQ
jgi:hypothetical protein